MRAFRNARELRRTGDDKAARAESSGNVEELSELVVDSRPAPMSLMRSSES
jgi:hypothetical protein